MSDLDSLRLDPIYQYVGVDADIATEDADETIRIIDKTAGLEVPLGENAVATVRPCATVRMTELAAKSLALSTLTGATLTFSGSTWRIKDYRLRPGIGGQSTGEALLILGTS